MILYCCLEQQMDEILCNKLSFFLRKSDEKIQENVQITKNVEKKRVKSFHINVSNEY